MFKKSVLAASILLLSAPLSASIIKIPPTTQGELTYATLPCSDQQTAYIRELVSSMGNSGWLDLLSNQKHLKFIGSQIDTVHPLKFLAAIFVTPDLKIEMAKILDSYLKKDQMLDKGLIPNLDREADKGTLMKYLVPFAEDVRVSPDVLRPYFERRDWESMVRFLIQS